MWDRSPLPYKIVVDSRTLVDVCGPRWYDTRVVDRDRSVHTLLDPAVKENKYCRDVVGLSTPLTPSFSNFLIVGIRSSLYSHWTLFSLGTLSLVSVHYVYLFTC